MTVVPRRKLKAVPSPLTEAPTGAKPIPRRTPISLYGPGGTHATGGESSDSEGNLIAAMLTTGGLDAVRAAGITEADFADEQWASVFRAVLAHQARYKTMPTWKMLVPDLGMFTVELPNTPGPLDYYIDRLHERIRYDVLASGASAVAVLLSGGDISGAHRALVDVVADLEVVGRGSSSLTGLLQGSDLLAADPLPLEWLVQGVWVKGSYGMIGAAEKSLKSYVSTELMLAVASGTNFLGRFEVPEAAPVLAYIGEGGQRLLQARAQKLAEGMELEPRDIQDRLYVDCSSGALDNDRALSLLADRVRDAEAGLVVVDPWYKFHGGSSNAANLFEQGSLLTELADAAGDAALMVIHHFNQTGGKSLDLKRLSMAGAAEWSDSWMLIKKEQEDVENGSFLLAVDLGSRHWGGKSIYIDAQVGQIDPATFQLSGEVKLRAMDNMETREAVTLPRNDRKAEALVGKLTGQVQAQPWTFTKTQLAEAVGGNRQSALAATNALIADGVLLQKGQDGKGSGNLLGM